jgi:tRNA dimethylallyltransferase
VPILVGGSGLYIRTLLDGIAPVPPIDPLLREAVRALPVEHAYAALQAEDGERAAALNPADTARIARALEVVRSTGQPLAHWQEGRVGGIGEAIDLHPLVLLPPRETLYARCDARFERMVENGAIEEVAALLARNLDPALPVMRAIGVPEIAGFLSGECSHDVMLARGRQATRNYAKRQYTWFRRQPPESWPRRETESCDIASYFERLFAVWRLT